MKRLYLLCILFSFFVMTSMYTVYGQQKRLKFEHLTTSDGLSQSTTTCILQDSKGFMWFGTQDGLNKYDGYKFTILRYESKDSTSISGNAISAIIEDRKGNLWIGTEGGLDLFNQAKNCFIHYRHDENDINSLSSNDIYVLLEDSRDNLWIGTNGGGLNLFDRDNERFIHFSQDENNPHSLSSDDIYTIFEDSRNNLWIGSWHGDLYLFDRDDQIFHHHYYKNKKLSNNVILDITEDKDGNLWIGTHGDGLYKMIFSGIGDYKFSHYTHDVNDINTLSGNAVFTILEDSQGRLWIGCENEGLNLFDRKNDKFIHYKSDSFDDKSLSHNSVWSLYEDRTGNIWIGTFAGGINLLPRYGGYFRHYNHNPGEKGSLSNNSVTSFYKDSKNNFWIGTDGGGLNLFDREKEIFIHYNTHNSNLSSDAVLSLLEDSRGNFWVGTWAGGLNLFDRESANFIKYTKENSGLSSNNIFTILEDRRGVLWVGSFWGGVSYFDRNSNTFINYTSDNSNLSDNNIRVITEDSNGNLWIGGDLALNCFNPEKETFVMYRNDENNDSSISKGRILSILEASDSTLWIGTTAGLNKLNRKYHNFIHYLSKDGLPNNIIKGIQEDENGNLWLSTNRGLSRFNPKTQTFKNYDISDGLQDNEFYQCSHYKSKSGEIFFGGVNGFNAFHPDDLIPNPYIPPIAITDFRIFNKPVEISKNSPLQTHISEATTIRLSYKHSVFSFEFTALNFISSDKNQYSYKLDGFDQDWNNVGTKHNATYTNLDPGEYIFRVRGSNNDGIWNEEGTSIKIIITPPFWKTWWFRVIAVLSILALLFISHKIRTTRIRKRNQELEQHVLERTRQLEEINKELEAFTYSVSHDLRAPLRRIAGFSQALLEDFHEQIDKRAADYLHRIQRGSSQMSRLIDDLLKLSRLSRGELLIRQVNVSQIVTSISEEYKRSFPDRSVQFSIAKNIYVQGDDSLLKVMIRNLIDNAWKFTSKQKEAKIEFGAMNVKGKTVYFIRDNGIGFDFSASDKIFEVFHRQQSEFEGTGIGLATVKRIIQRHNGRVWSEGKINEGATFYFTL
jgi:two-component system sensor histidine kinase ChiS